MADDLGYADVSCYGRRDYTTANIDRLARDGMRFMQAYANSAVCSATRTALITGRYQYRYPIGLEEPLNTRDVGLSPDVPTLPSLLKKAGYATALIGKWHLGSPPKYGPEKSGYDRFYGFIPGSSDYFNHANSLWDGGEKANDEGYLTDLLGDRAVSTVESFARARAPFLISLHFNAPHWPWEGPEDQSEVAPRHRAGRQRSFHFDGGSLATYAQDGARDGRSDRPRADRARARRRRREHDRHLHQRQRRRALLRHLAVLGQEDRAARRRRADTRDRALAGPRARGLDLEPDDHVDGLAADAAGGGGCGDRSVIAAGWHEPRAAACAARRPSRANCSGATSTICSRRCATAIGNISRSSTTRFLFNVVDDPLERANLKERRRDIYDRLAAEWRAWNATMLPLDPMSSTGGFGSNELADHMGAPARERAPSPGAASR